VNNEQGSCLETARYLERVRNSVLGYIPIRGASSMGFDGQKEASAHPIGKHSRATLQVR
jgi:hypothetical protein